MNFVTLSSVSVLAGIATIAIALWFAQRLRVRHREVEVLSTIFWKQALEETRARVFVRRFRHWWAWAMLVAIASLLWVLLASPQTISFDRTKHVVLVGQSSDDVQTREQGLLSAISFTRTLPANDRQIIAVGTQLESLLRPGEPVDLARLRGQGDLHASPRDITWAIEALSAQAKPGSPLTIHVVGDAVIDEARLERIGLLAAGMNASKELLRVKRVKREATARDPLLATLGVSDSLAGDWDLVDIWISFDESEQGTSDRLIVLSQDGETLEHALAKRDDGTYELRGLKANGATIDVSVGGRPIGSITLPNRSVIRIRIESEVPETLRKLVQLDPACVIVESDPDVTIGSSTSANFRLAPDRDSALRITAPTSSPEETLANLVDRLALRQIDATGIAESSGRVVDVQVVPGATRSIAIWKSLFTSEFDFLESRVCPILVARSIRWLADPPTLVPWVELGQQLPEAAPEFARVLDAFADSDDGQRLRSTRLASTMDRPATLPLSIQGSSLASMDPLFWLGLVVSLLLAGEWMLYQRGQIP